MGCLVAKEHKEQYALVQNLRKKGICVFAIPNHQEQRKESGAVAGMPDLQVILKGGKVIWIELKRTKGGRLSDKQKEVHATLEHLEHIVIVGYGAKDALEKLEPYLS